MYNVCIYDARHGCRCKDAPWTLRSPFFVSQKQRVLGRMLRTPVYSIRIVGYTIAGCELTARLEHLYELVFLWLVGGGTCDLASRGDACGEEFRILGVEIEQVLCDELTL